MDEEISHQLNTLGFAPEWLDRGFLDATPLQTLINAYENSDDPHTEHFRYGAFLHILQSRLALDDEGIAHYRHLATIDPDPTMGQAALCDLLLWPGLSAPQQDEMAQWPELAAPRFQKLIERARLWEETAAGPLTADLFARCIASSDARLQREILQGADVTEEQRRTLAERGATRAVRNIARSRRSSSPR